MSSTLSSQEDLISIDHVSDPSGSTPLSQQSESWSFTEDSRNSANIDTTSNSSCTSSTETDSFKPNQRTPQPNQPHRNSNSNSNIDEVAFNRLIRGQNVNGVRMVILDEIVTCFESVCGEREVMDEGKDMRRYNRGRLVGGQEGIFPKRKVKGWGFGEIEKGVRMGIGREDEEEEGELVLGPEEEEGRDEEFFLEAKGGEEELLVTVEEQDLIEL